MFQITQSHLDNFSPLLKEVIDDELAHGNAIVETSSGWPDKETIMVFLRKPFYRSHDRPGLEFRDINDPHWWKSEYFDRATRHVLACKFE